MAQSIKTDILTEKKKREKFILIFDYIPLLPP